MPGCNKNVIGCKCCGGGPTIVNCKCNGQNKSTWSLNWKVWGWHTNPDSSRTQEYLPNVVGLTYYANRPAYTYTDLDKPGNPTYFTEWGPGWYSDLEKWNPKNGSSQYPDDVDHIWFMQCSSSGFSIRRNQQNPVFSAGTIIGYRWLTSPPTGLPIPDNPQPPYNGGNNNTYATGPNTCSYLYYSTWSGGDPSHPDNGLDGYLKSGIEYELT